MLVQMTVACVAGRQPRQAGEVVEVTDSEAKTLLALRLAVVAPVAAPPASASPETATIEPPRTAVLPRAQAKKTTRRGGA